MAPVGVPAGGSSWYANTNTVVSLLIVLAASLSLPYFRKLNEWFPRHHPGLLALVSGTVVMILTYPAMRVADRKYAFSNAVLLGLLVAEFCVYGAPLDFPAPVAISFFFFMYSYGRVETEHLWPKNHTGPM